MKKVLIVFLCLCLCLSSALASEAPEEESRIGILSAMDNEVQLLLSRAEIERVDTVGGVDFHVGTLCGQPVVIARAGIGKVLAASGTATMLNRYPISAVIFTGIAGGVGDRTRVLDIVIGTRLVQHDYGMQKQDGFEWAATSGGIEGYYYSNPSLVASAYRAAVATVGRDHAFMGVIATGDQFIASGTYVRFLQSSFGAIACEMEGASVAAVCEQFRVPYVVIRCMSDKADGSAQTSMENFGDDAANRSGSIVMRMLSGMGGDH